MTPTPRIARNFAHDHLRTHLNGNRCVGWIAIILLCIAPSAHAGTHLQGTHLQGTHLQGTHLQGTHLQGTHLQRSEAWLWGTRLLGVFPQASPTKPRVIEILGFHGNVIDALAWRDETGWRRVQLAPADLVGMRWLEHRCHRDPSCPRITYRIRAVRRDQSLTTMPAYRDNATDVWLYDIEFKLLSPTARTEGRTAWTSACPVRRGHEGGGGLFVDGHWREDGSWRPAGYTFACPSGVIAKCVRGWGYKPWRKLRAPKGKPIALGPLHRACVRTARADYCGDGVSHTKDGTRIDLFDGYGFNRLEGRQGFVPEAGFSDRGAVWLQRPRYDWPACVGIIPRALEAGSRGERSRTESHITVWSYEHQ